MAVAMLSRGVHFIVENSLPLGKVFFFLLWGTKLLSRGSNFFIVEKSLSQGELIFYCNILVKHNKINIGQ